MSTHCLIRLGLLSKLKLHDWSNLSLVRKMAQVQAQELVYVDFEIHGKVQGVFFRKHTQAEGNKLGLRGHCRNTSAGTVTGSMEGPRPEVDKMKYWLQNTGSPKSNISKAVFKNEKVIERYGLQPGFDIRR